MTSSQCLIEFSLSNVDLLTMYQNQMLSFTSMKISLKFQRFLEAIDETSAYSYLVLICSHSINYNLVK